MDAELRERIAQVIADASGYPHADAWYYVADALAPIIAEVEAAAVERCAKVAEEYDCGACGAWFHPSVGHYDENCPKGRSSWNGQRDAEHIAAAIRAQKEPSA